jgi:large subunit ribosomal protein L30
MNPMTEKKGRCLALIRLRGNVGIRKEFEYVFKLLHLTRKNHVTLLEETESSLGMIRKIKDYSTWGEVTLETLSLLLKKRGRLQGNKKLTNDYVKNELGFSSIAELAQAIYTSDINFWKLSNIKPIFRLHPPRKGFRKSIRKPYPNGELGYRGEEINKLIFKMM